MNRKDSGSGVLIAVVGILILAIIALLIGTYWNNARQDAVAHITDFASCKADAGSRIQESYPETCVTSDGRNFTGPNDATPTVPDEKLKTYCTTGEQLCFKYPESWTVTNNKDANSKSRGPDRLDVASADKTLNLNLESGIYGIGGTCDPQNRVTVNVLESTEIPKLKGFKTDYTYSLDKPRVARVVLPEEGKYSPALYVASDSQYTNVSVLKACGIYFSNLIEGKRTDITDRGADKKEHGLFKFGLSKTQKFDTLKEAKAAYSTASYQQAAAILASLYYK